MGCGPILGARWQRFYVRERERESLYGSAICVRVQCVRGRV